MRKVIKFEPSSEFTTFSKGDVFSVGEDRKSYCILHIDPWFTYCCRWYWFDKYLGMLYEYRSTRSKRADNKD